MANRLVGNTWIIDTTGALSTQPETRRGALRISGVGFYSLNTTSVVNIAASANTTNILFPLAADSHFPKFEVFAFAGESVTMEELNVITVTAGTAYLYLA